MSNQAKQKARRKRYEKVRNYKNNNLPGGFKRVALSQKMADSLYSRTFNKK